MQLLWFAGEKLGFTISSPPYLSVRASGQNLLKGANFASAGSGFYEPTALMFVSISFINGLSISSISWLKIKSMSSQRNEKSYCTVLNFGLTWVENMCCRMSSLCPNNWDILESTKLSWQQWPGTLELSQSSLVRSTLSAPPQMISARTTTSIHCSSRL